MGKRGPEERPSPSSPETRKRRNIDRDNLYKILVQRDDDLRNLRYFHGSPTSVVHEIISLLEFDLLGVDMNTMSDVGSSTALLYGNNPPPSEFSSTFRRGENTLFTNGAHSENEFKLNEWLTGFSDIDIDTEADQAVTVFSCGTSVLPSEGNLVSSEFLPAGSILDFKNLTCRDKAPI